MITNTDITIYHKVLNQETHLEEYVRYYYKNCWKYGGKGSSLNKGYVEANDVSVRIPYNMNENANIEVFSIGDIIYIGNGQSEIESQNDLSGEIYNITSITNNTFGNNPHIHLGGK